MCSPELLTPRHGRRIRLLHVVKKSVSPKISASKMDTPSYTSLPIFVESKSKSKTTTNTSALDREILPLLAQTTVVTSSAPVDGGITSSTTWGSRAESPAVNTDVTSSRPAAQSHHEKKPSESSGKGFALFRRRGNSSPKLRDAQINKLPCRPQTSGAHVWASDASPWTTLETTHRPRPATADGTAAPYVSPSNIGRPPRQPLQLSIPKPDLRPVLVEDSGISPVNLHASPVDSRSSPPNTPPSPVRIGGPIATKEQIREWLSEISSPPLSPSSIHSRASNSSFSPPLSPSPPAHRGAIPWLSHPSVAERPSLPSPPRVRSYTTTNGRKRPSTANGTRRSSPRLPPPTSSSGLVSLSSTTSRL